MFYGDVYRPEVLNAFNVGKAKAVICTLSDIKGTNKAVVNLRREFPDLPVSAGWLLYLCLPGCWKNNGCFRAGSVVPGEGEGGGDRFCERADSSLPHVLLIYLICRSFCVVV